VTVSSAVGSLLKPEARMISTRGISKRDLIDRLAGPNTLLNLSYSIHPPLLLGFERSIFCDLDPSELPHWMTRMEMGQSSHHEPWTIGLNMNSAECKLLRVVAGPVSDAPSKSHQQRRIGDVRTISPANRFYVRAHQRGWRQVLGVHPLHRFAVPSSD
jgi:hypothetical protein